MAAYSRLLTQKSALYDMNDVTIEKDTQTTEPEQPGTDTETGQETDLSLIHILYIRDFL